MNRFCPRQWCRVVNGRAFAPVHWLEDRGLKLEKVTVGQIRSQFGDEPAPLPERIPALRIDDKIKIPLRYRFSTLVSPWNFSGREFNDFVSRTI